MCSCAQSGALPNVNLINNVQGCFTFLNKGIQQGEPVILNLEVHDMDATQDCQCKSALFKYFASQERGKDVFSLISGNFTAINKKYVLLPVSVQLQLIYKELPLNVYITCANP